MPSCRSGRTCRTSGRRSTGCRKHATRWPAWVSSSNATAIWPARLPRHPGTTAAAPSGTAAHRTRGTPHEQHLYRRHRHDRLRSPHRTQRRRPGPRSPRRRTQGRRLQPRRPRHRLLRRHDQRPAAGPDRDPRPGGIQQDRHRRHPRLQHRERLRLGQLGLQPGGAEPQGRHYRCRAGPRRGKDEHPRQAEGLLDLRGRLGRFTRRRELPDPGQHGRRRGAATRLRVGQAL
ncbi:hypothetical protein D9M71_420700 [compost metagenome]